MSIETAYPPRPKPQRGEMCIVFKIVQSLVRLSITHSKKKIKFYTGADRIPPTSSKFVAIGFSEITAMPAFAASTTCSA